MYSRNVITILICCIIICFNFYYLEFHGKGLGIYTGTYYTTAITHTFQTFIFIITSIIVLLNAFYPRKVYIEMYSSLIKPFFQKFVFLDNFVLNKMSEQFRIIEYPLIILFIIIGGAFLMSSYDLISIFISIELQSYGLYILCAIYRNSERALSGALTYFLLGGLSSCFILLGSGLLYSNSGNTGFDGLFVINNIYYAEINFFDKLDYESWYDSYYINFSLIIMSVGLLFKVSAAPFHFWSPEVYDAIPTVVTTFVAIFAKISIFILLLNLVHHTSDIVSLSYAQEYAAKKNSLSYSWTFTLIISSLLSLIIGSVLGLTQFRVKKLYAYSTISHIGFILLALTINSIESVQSFIFYLMQYSLANLNAFMLLLIVGYSLFYYTETSKNKDVRENGDQSNEEQRLHEKNNSPLQLVTQLKGFFHVNPVISISLALTLFSFVGIPPLVGFFAKQMVLSSAIDNGFIFMTFVGILTSVISAYYYLVLIKQMFFFKSDYTFNPLLNNIGKGNITNKSGNNIINTVNFNKNDLSVSSYLSISISILTLVILMFILTPQEWLNLANILALIMFSN